jgi:hypothetical protein
LIPNGTIVGSVLATPTVVVDLDDAAHLGERGEMHEHFGFVLPKWALGQLALLLLRVP